MAYIIGGDGQPAARKAPGSQAAKRSKSPTVAVELPRDLTVTVTARDLAKLTTVSAADVAKAAAPARTAKAGKKGRRPSVARKSKKKGARRNLCWSCGRLALQAEPPGRG